MKKNENMRRKSEDSPTVFTEKIGTIFEYKKSVLMDVPMSYSVDFRNKIVDAYKNKEGSMRTLANRFNVTLVSVFKIWHGYKSSGNVIPKPHGGGVPRKITADGEKFIIETLNKQNDKTEKELCDEYFKQFNVSISQPTMNRTLNNLKLTRKKKLLRFRKRK